MTNEQRELWRKIAEFPLDRADAPLPFSRRLARENGWSPTYTRRVLDEYRRFLFLAVAAGHPVSPSADVDEAWHLHLLYTESYWTDLCQNTLGRPVHHGPTRGGAAEGAKFEDWYARTLASYRRLFGAEPPADIWPATHRPSPPPPPRKADTDCWTLRIPKRPVTPLALAGVALLLAGAAGGEALGFLFVGLITLGLVLVVAGAVSGSTSKDRRRPSGGAGGTGGSGDGGSSFDAGGVFHYGGSEDNGSGHHGSHHHGGHSGDSGSDSGGDSGGGDSSGGGSSGCGGD